MKTTRAALYARISTSDQQTLPMQLQALRRYARERGFRVTMEVEEVQSGAKERPRRDEILKAARRKQIDLVLVWKLDRWGRSVLDLIHTLHELQELRVGFVSLTEALDLTTPTGRAMTGMLAVFAEFERELLRERINAGIAQAQQAGKHCGRPPSALLHRADIVKRFRKKEAIASIARNERVSRSSVRRILVLEKLLR